MDRHRKELVLVTMLRTLRTTFTPGRVEAVTHLGRPAIEAEGVALVSPLVVTPMHASAGELVTPSALRPSVDNWVGVALVPVHPLGNGEPISATTTPELHMGTVTDSRFESGRLILTSRFSVEAMARLHAFGAGATLQRLVAASQGKPVTRPIEVSVGAYVTLRQVDGIHGGRRYGFEWVSVEPDHLAAGLAGKEGACSVTDGCGLLRAATTYDSEGVNTMCSTTLNDAPTPAAIGAACVALGPRARSEIMSLITRARSLAAGQDAEPVNAYAEGDAATLQQIDAWLEATADPSRNPWEKQPAGGHISRNSETLDGSSVQGWIDATDARKAG